MVERFELVVDAAAIYFGDGGANRDGCPNKCRAQVLEAKFGSEQRLLLRVAMTGPEQTSGLLDPLQQSGRGQHVNVGIAPGMGGIRRADNILGFGIGANRRNRH
ncbi:MAG TPA: hypothetical protein VMW62_11145 [Chloroflexota bacterium]|nr:hypothetical protein [Chloroflexota bacterium]